MVKKKARRSSSLESRKDPPTVKAPTKKQRRSSGYARAFRGIRESMSLIQNLKGGQSEEGKATLAKFNKALGIKDKRVKGPKGAAGDKRQRRAPAGGGGDMGLAAQIIDQDTGGLSEFGAHLRNTAPSVQAALRKLKVWQATAARAPLRYRDDAPSTTRLPLVILLVVFHSFLFC